MDTFYSRHGTECVNLTVEHAMEKAGLNFEVGLKPVFAMQPDAEGVEDLLPVKNSQATYRKDTGAVLAVVGSRYTPGTHLGQKEDGTAFGTFAGLKRLVDDGMAEVQTAGCLRGGADVFMQAKFKFTDPNVNEALAGSGVSGYATVTDNHAGRRKGYISDCPTRIVCGNTFARSIRLARQLVRAGGRAAAISHTKSAPEQWEEAAKRLWGNVQTIYRDIAIQIELLRNTTLSEQEMGRLVLDIIAPLPLTPPSSARGKTAQEKVVNKRERVRGLWDTGLGHDGDHSAWEAVQAAVQSIDHDEQWATRGGRFEALFDGSLAQKKQLVMETVMEHVIDASGDLLQRIVDRYTPGTISIERLI